jgi:hypothetical protein
MRSRRRVSHDSKPPLIASAGAAFHLGLGDAFAVPDDEPIAHGKDDAVPAVVAHAGHLTPRLSSSKKIVSPETFHGVAHVPRGSANAVHHDELT